jgi:EAL domain-containing protein (putative c-di-GMP-specific phosphodiesterase class I)
MTTTAEGVETHAQLQVVESLGCTEMQGHLYSRPVPAADLAKLLPITAKPARCSAEASAVSREVEQVRVDAA